MFAQATLARWLGPWASATAVPRGIVTREDRVDELRVRVYLPRSPGARGSTFLIAPGLHYAGADDPRLDRFCRVLAAAGHQVLAPFIPGYLALVPSDRAKHDFERVFAARARWTAAPPVVFSISFGSLLAFALAARHGDAIARLVIFGGYADLGATLHFALTGDAGGRTATRDPLNQPVVFANLLALLEPPADPAIVAHWRRYVERTWGRPECKARARYVAIAEELAPTVPPHLRELFLVGIGALPGARALAEPAIRKLDSRPLDPTPYLAHIRGRVDLVHGTDDDVIPFEQSHALAAKLVHADARVHVTGLYDHTGSALPRPSAIVRELRTMLAILDVLS